MTTTATASGLLQRAGAQPLEPATGSSFGPNSIPEK